MLIVNGLMIDAIRLVEVFLSKCLSALARETEEERVKRVCEDLLHLLEEEPDAAWRSDERPPQKGLPPWVG